MFDSYFQTFVFIHINEFSTLSTHRTEMRQSNSEREMDPRCRDVETLMNLNLFIFLNLNICNKFT